MEKIETFVSVIAICRNVADFLEDFVAPVCGLLETRYTNYELVLVDDHSEDGTLAKAEAILSRQHCVRLIGLSRTMGIEIATMAGLESAIGDFVVTLQPDRDPPEHITRMVEMVQRGQDIVIGVTDTTRHRSAAYRLLHRFYFALCRRLIQVELIPGNTAFCALSRQAVNAITRIRQRKRMFVIVASETGYPITTYAYRQRFTSAGRRDRGFLASIRLGSSILFHNSNVPLRLVSGVGLVGSFLCVLYGVYIVVINLLKDTVEGWTTLSLQVNGLFFLVFLMLTLLGEYMVRVLDESIERPLYHVRGEKASYIMISDTTRPNVLEESIDEDAATKPLAESEASDDQ